MSAVVLFRCSLVSFILVELMSTRSNSTEFGCIGECAVCYYVLVVGLKLVDLLYCSN